MRNLFYNIPGFIKKPACAIIALLFMGCAGAGIKPNKDVMKSFEGSPKANHSYFLSGTANSPKGIIGIDNAYRLESDLWKPVDPSSIQKIVKTMNDRAEEASASTSSGDIISIDGKDVGDCLLFFGDWPYVQVKEGIVRVYPPDGLGSGGGGSGGSGGSM